MQGEELVGGDVVTPSGRIRGYLVTSDDEEANKENDEDAMQVSQVRQVAEGMGDSAS